ncbi:MAG: hypothetical protein ACRD68_02495 [Pyrinomonadaceae bacterium]
MLSREDAEGAAREALAESGLDDRFELEGIGWPGAAGVLKVTLEDRRDRNLTTLYVAWEPSAETPDGFKEKIKQGLARFGIAPEGGVPK